MLRFATLLLLSGAAVAAQPPASPQCAYDAAYLSAQLGQQFKPGVPENGLLGKACRYDANGIKVWVDAGPNPAPSAQLWRKMANPPGTTWAAVPGDPDQAVHTIAKSDVSPFPSLSYERKGLLVNITVTGISGKAAIDAWNAKLARLKRLP